MKSTPVVLNVSPLWKTFLILLLVGVAVLYAVPNLYREMPAVQISGRTVATAPNAELQTFVTTALKTASISFLGMVRDSNTLRYRFSDSENQIKARDVILAALDQAPTFQQRYHVSLALMSSTPNWLGSLHARPMPLGLDLQGGVHFLFEIEEDKTLQTHFKGHFSKLLNTLRQDKILHRGIREKGPYQRLVLFRTDQQRQQAQTLWKSHSAREALEITALPLGPKDSIPALLVTLSSESQEHILEEAVTQNITTLRNRINDLGISEPIIQQQGRHRIVVELPGVQDVAAAKRVLGRTATLEMRLVHPASNRPISESTPVPAGATRFYERGADQKRRPIFLRQEVFLTGEHILRASAGFDNNNRPAVHIRLDSVGSDIFRRITQQHTHQRLAILLIENQYSEVITAPKINEAIPNGNVQITGNFLSEEAAELALLLRSGALAAPMRIVEERTVGPSLGAQNIQQGLQSMLWGFVLLNIFILLYYRTFGLISVLALSANLILLVALLSLLQATLTLPGIAAISLALGMAIDANVLINERIREELRQGQRVSYAIDKGYAQAWGTILDSNITTLIAGITLFIFSSGPVRGFAIVHSLGILTSMFSAVLVSRALVNFIFGRYRASESRFARHIGLSTKQLPSSPPPRSL